mmetsp:Transcript_4788/g.5442  ORF Transcript_4788/g.5442 Transcript_4788/m.5442 type:complete len:86 (+) Transcript_4788:214-471(+)
MVDVSVVVGAVRLSIIPCIEVLFIVSEAFAWVVYWWESYRYCNSLSGVDDDNEVTNNSNNDAFDNNEESKPPICCVVSCSISWTR